LFGCAFSSLDQHKHNRSWHIQSPRWC